jgi:predicted RNA binding protein YcfA (HicA-like mRNA interferase family)
MPKLSPVGSRELVKILKKKGFRELRRKGSHLRLAHPDGRKTTVPMHSGESVGVGLLNKILKDANISREEFFKLK